LVDIIGGYGFLAVATLLQTVVANGYGKKAVASYNLPYILFLLVNPRFKVAWVWQDVIPSYINIRGCVGMAGCHTLLCKH
jgi:hypothetical protein